MGDLDDFEVSDTPSVGSPLLGLGMQAEAHEAGDGEVCAISEETEVVQTVARVEEGQMDKCAVPLRSLPADSELQVQGFSLREVEETRLPAKKEETPSDERHLSSDASSSDVEITQSSVVNSPTNPVIQLVSATVTPPRLCLHLHVENRHFSKHLSALYTADRWATTKTSALGTFVGPVEGKDGWDVFEVTLDLDGPCRIDAAFKLEMGGTDYWDSRGGLNHFFVVERRKNVQPKETDAVADCVEGLIHETVLRELITRTSPSMTPSSLFRPASSVSLNSSPTSDEDRFDDFDGWKRPDSAIWLPSYRNSLSSIMSREEVGAKRDLTVDPVIKEEDEDGASVVVIVAEKEAGADDDFVEIKSRVDDGGAAVVSRNAVAMAKLQAEDTAIDKDGENAAMDVVIAEVEDKEQAKEVLVIDIQELTADAGTADIIAEADVDLSAKEARVESDDRAMCTEVTPVEAELETANVVAPAEVETHAEDSLVEVKESLANDAVMSKSEHSPDALTCVIATAESAEDITQVWIDDITVATDLYERSGNVTVVVEGETEEVTLISVEGEAVHGRDFEIIAKEARDVRVQGIEVIVKVEPEIDIDTNNAENRLKGLAIAAVAREEAQDGTVIQRLHEAVEDACLAAEVEELSDDSPETDDKKISVATKTEGLNRGIADTASNYDQIVPYGELDSVPGVVTQEQLEGSIVVAYTIVEEPAIVAKPEVQPVIITAADGANDAEEAVANVSEAGEPASISEIVVATADKDVVSEEGLEAVGVADDVNAGAKNEDPVANQTAREHVVELDVQPEDVELEEFTINAAVDGARQVEDVTTTGSSEEQSVPTEVKEVPEHATFGQEVGERQEVVSVTVNLKRAEGEAADEEQNVAVVVGQQAEDIAGVTVVTESLEAIVTVELQTDVSIASDEQVEDRADEIDERVDSAVTLDDRKASEVVANDCQTESVVERIQELADIGNDDPADDETTIASAKDEYVLTNIAAVWADAGHLVEGGSSERAIDVTLEGAAKAQGLSIVDVDKKVHVVEAAVAEARKVAVQLESDVVAQEKARAVVSEEEEVVGREVSAAKLGVEKGVDDVKAETDGAGVAVNTVQEVLMEGGVDIDGTGRQAVDVEMRDLAISEASSMATEDPGERVVVDGKSDAQKAEATAEEPVIAVLSIEPLLDDLGAPSVDDEALVMPEIGKTPEAADETKEKQVIQREHISFDSVDLIDRHVDVDVDAAEAVKAGTINLHEVDFANRDMDVSVAELPMEVDVATKKMAPALDYKPAEWSDVEEVARLHSAISSISWTKAADDQLEGGVHSVFAEVASLRNVSLIAFIAHFAMVSIAYIVPKIGSAIAVLFEPVRIGHALVACIVVLMVVGTGRRAVEGK
ncbi:hypothetical protein HK101_011185 [Irineochytrium annulatum]|nr:hypothetical protein HK101_011185 [Irineochytrium annulatum]